MSEEGNRLLMVWDKTLKEVNRSVINPEIKDLGIEDIKPVLELVARSRADYLKMLFDIAAEYETGLLPEQKVLELKQHRESYEELVAAAQALETAVKRNYLDVHL